MANQTSEYIGTALGISSVNGETRKIKTDDSGNLQISALPIGTNTIGNTNTQSQTTDITLLASGTFTISGTGTPNTTIGIYREAIIVLDVTAASGTTPALNVDIQFSPDGTNWYTIDSFTQKTAVNSEVKRITNFGGRLRVNYTIAGTTPSFTFKVLGTFKS